MLLQELTQKKLVSPPTWLPTNTMYLTIMGSHAYGAADTNSEKKSDWDIYGFCIPKKEIVFPHLAGVISGFGDQGERFEQWVQHHVIDPSACKGQGREYDFSIYNIVKYFDLLMENNPNVIDSIFTPQDCVIHCTEVALMVREKRRIFLHTGAYTRFKGYAYSQLHKMGNRAANNQHVQKIRNLEDLLAIPHRTTLEDVEKEMKRRSDTTEMPFPPYGEIAEALSKLNDHKLTGYYSLLKKGVDESSRFESRKEHNSDLKFAMHLVRLLNECEQILLEGDLDLQRDNEHLKAIRRGEVPEEQIREWFKEKEKTLEKLFADSKLPARPDEREIKSLLLRCLEHHYGSLEKAVVVPDLHRQALGSIRTILDGLGI
jgi:hypothetical protein